MNILSREEILKKGKNIIEEIAFDPLTGIYEDMNTEIPYNGIGYTLFSDGEIESYAYYVNGIEDIQSFEFHYNGNLKEYYEMKKGLLDGEFIKLNEEEIMIYWAEYEVNILKRFKEWNDQGELIDEKKEPTLKDLEKIRKKNKSK